MVLRIAQPHLTPPLARSPRSYQSPFKFDLIGRNCLFMLVMGVVFFLLTILFEYRRLRQHQRQTQTDKVGCAGRASREHGVCLLLYSPTNLPPPLFRVLQMAEKIRDDVLDDDVKREMDRINQGIKKHASSTGIQRRCPYGSYMLRASFCRPGRCCA